MLRSGRMRLDVLVLLLGLLGACGRAGEEVAPPAPTAEAVVEGEAGLTPAEPVETATSVPATTTPIPATDIPQPAAASATPTEAPSAATASADPPQPPRSGGEAPAAEAVLQEYPAPEHAQPHDVAPAPDGTVWYTAQGSGELGRLDPRTGETRHIPLGAGSAPHGVIIGPDGAAWVTDGGLNAIVRVDGETEGVEIFPLPEGSGYANLNTATFDGRGILWFTGQSGIYGRLDPASGVVEVFEAPGGRGPYGITTTPKGEVYYASLAGSHIAQINIETGEATVIEPPTPGQGARRVWSDSQGRIWVSEWEAGQVGMYEPATQTWREWPLPGAQPKAYAVYVDERDIVWLSDFGSNSLVSFDPAQESFEIFSLPSPTANVRQILGRPGEVWGAESGASKLVVIRTQ